jgi:tyrosine-protein phosphatase SIW14
MVMLLAATLSCASDGSSSSRERTQPSTDSRLASPRALPGVGNFAKVDDGLFRGEQPTAEGFATLEDLGVKTIINLRNKSSDRELLTGRKVDLVEIPVRPHDLDEAQVLAFMKVATDPRRRPAFVHCHHGADRTGAMVAVYRMVVQDWPRQDALAELPRFGFHRVWVNLKQYVRRFDPSAIKASYPSAKAPPVIPGRVSE